MWLEDVQEAAGGKNNRLAALPTLEKKNPRSQAGDLLVKLGEKEQNTVMLQK